LIWEKVKVLSGITDERIKQNMTQQKLADLMCVGQSTVATWETKGSLPHASKLPLLAKVLDCTTDDILRKGA
jgi:transcriptional regulator with XRE-family HTH domain